MEYPLAQIRNREQKKNKHRDVPLGELNQPPCVGFTEQEKAGFLNHLTMSRI
jgi:hypothetical protein